MSSEKRVLFPVKELERVIFIYNTIKEFDSCEDEYYRHTLWNTIHSQFELVAIRAQSKIDEITLRDKYYKKFVRNSK